MMVGGRSNGKVRLQKINPAALWGEASEMECRLLADSVAKVPKCRATNFPQKDKTSGNHRSI
jgi:hypothetical protein